jgi:hypothetical protein
VRTAGAGAQSDSSLSLARPRRGVRDDWWGPPVGASGRRVREKVADGGCLAGWAACYAGQWHGGGLPRGKRWSGLGASRPGRRKGGALADFELLGCKRNRARRKEGCGEKENGFD